jgi:hypothetical protein
MEKGSISPQQQSRRAWMKLLYYWSTGDEAIDDNDHRDDEQQMDQAATYVHDEEPKNPQNKENYRDGPKHDGILARSELHPTRQKTYPALAHLPRSPCVTLGYTMQDGNQHAVWSSRSKLCQIASTPNKSLCAAAS